MTEQEPKITSENTQTDLQEEYLKSLDQLEEGQLIKGNVIQVGPEYVFVDVGYKSEGKVPVDEFKEKPAIGDPVDVVLLRKEGREGEIVVSKSKADEKVLWKELREAFENNEPVEGTFEKSIKGGFEVDLGFNIKAFNPISKTDVSRVEDPEKWVGVTSKFLIDRLYSDNKLKIVLSRRDWIDREIEEKRQEFFSTTSIGDEVVGKVKSFTSFGAFIDLGGFDGLLHINDMSWGHVTRPKDYVSKGQEISLKVIKLDPEELKINLSLKHFTPDPWSVFEEKYQVGDVVRGSVTKLTDFGAFIELEEGIEGLAHISELSWVKRINHPKELLKVGDEVETKILSYDLMKGRVSLGIKQVQDNPWDTIDERYPVGTVVNREVKKITNAGAFVELEEGIDAFIHVDDFSWTKKIKNPGSVLNEGETYDFKVISIDKENFRVRVGMKQLSTDPWDTLASKYNRGDSIEGVITSITDFGVFVRVENEIEGLIHKSNLSSPAPGEELSDDEILSKYHEGDSITAAIIELNAHRKKLALSMKEYQKKIQREELSKYIHDEEDESTATFGDILKNKETNQIEK